MKVYKWNTERVYIRRLLIFILPTKETLNVKELSSSVKVKRFTIQLQGMVKIR
jgi:hypothetical protein